MTAPLLIGGAAGAIGFVLVFLIDGATRPGYRPTYHPVSALSLGDRGWVQTTNFIITGLLFLGGAIALGASIDRGTGGLVASILIGVVAVAVVVSGLFPMDPMRGYPPGTPPGNPAELSLRHKVHDAAGPIVFGVLPLACVAMAWSFASQPAEPPWAVYSGATGAALIALVVVFSRSWQRDAPSGLLQRVYLVVGWAWLAAMFIYLASTAG